MPDNFQRREIGKEIYLSKISDPRFKTNLISINFFTPLSEETASENAVVSHYLSKCSRKYPTYALMNNKLSAMYSTRLSGDVLQFGDTQALSFGINYIDGKYALDNEKMDIEAVEMITDCLFDPLEEKGKFDENLIKREKQSVIDDIESEINNKQSYASIKAAEIMYKGEPYALDILGTVKKAKEVTAESSYKAYLRMLKHCRVEIICSGVSDFEEVKKKLICTFSKLEREDIFPCRTEVSPLKQLLAKVRETMNVVQSNMIVGFKTDCQNSSAMILMNEIFGGTPTSKLFSNVREKMSLCYSCFSSFNWLKGALSVRCGVEKEKIEPAYEEILNQLELMKKGEFSEEDIANAKMYRRNYLKTFYDNLNAMAAWYMSRIYSDDLASPEEMMKRDEKITKEDIIKAAQSVKLDTFYVLTSDDNSQPTQSK